MKIESGELMLLFNRSTDDWRWQSHAESQEYLATLSYLILRSQGKVPV